METLTTPPTAPSTTVRALVAARPSRRFLVALAALLALAFAVRIGFVMVSARHDDKFYDAAWYELVADGVARGDGFVDPFVRIHDPDAVPGPTAQHPPLTSLVLVPVAWATGESQLAMRFTMVVLGTVTVGLVGLLARRLAGETTGLVAAGLAAVYPYLWVNDGLIMSETISALLVVASMYVAYALFGSARLRSALALGVLCGLATLARAELVLLAPLLLVPVVFGRGEDLKGMRVQVVGAVVLGGALVVTPWVAYNRARFDEPTFVSTNDGIAMLGSNCDAVYHGGALGLTNLAPGVCLPDRPPPGDDSVAARVYRDEAIDYMRENASRVPVVVAARIGRNWGFFRPGDMVSWNANEGRPRAVTRAGMWFYYPILVLAVAGTVVARRRRIRVWPLLVPAVVVTVSTVLSYGQTRFRVPAEPSLVILASVALVALAGRVRARRGRSDAGAPAIAPG